MLKWPTSIDTTVPRWGEPLEPNEKMKTNPRHVFVAGGNFEQKRSWHYLWDWLKHKRYVKIARKTLQVAEAEADILLFRKAEGPTGLWWAEFLRT